MIILILSKDIESALEFGRFEFGNVSVCQYSDYDRYFDESQKYVLCSSSVFSLHKNPDILLFNDLRPVEYINCQAHCNWTSTELLRAVTHGKSQWCVWKKGKNIEIDLQNYLHI